MTLDQARVIEVKHVAPFDGAFYEWEYYLERPYRNTRKLEIIYALPRHGKYPLLYHGMLWDLTGQLETGDGIEDYLYYGCSIDWAKTDYDLTFYKNLRVLSIDEHLHRMVPGAYEQRFWDVLHKRGLQYLWDCDICGLTNRRPMFPAGWRGDGHGVGIQIDNWLCSRHRQFEEYAED